MSDAAELRELAARLLSLADERSEPTPPALAVLRASEGGTALGGRLVPDDPVYLGRLAETFLRVRRLRGQHLGADLFADPAWDMLLDLFVQRRRGHRVSVTSLCIASQVPSTTALRWISIIVDRGLAQRETDTTDGRRIFIGLSETGERAVAQVLAQMGRLVAVKHRDQFMLVENAGL